MQEPQETWVFDSWVGNISWRKAWQPTQYSCLENPTERGAWQAAVHGVTESGALLSMYTQHQSERTCRGERALEKEAGRRQLTETEIQDPGQSRWPHSSMVHGHTRINDACTRDVHNKTRRKWGKCWWFALGNHLLTFYIRKFIIYKLYIGFLKTETSVYSLQAKMRTSKTLFRP